MWMTLNKVLNYSNLMFKEKKLARNEYIVELLEEIKFSIMLIPDTFHQAMNNWQLNLSLYHDLIS